MPFTIPPRLQEGYEKGIISFIWLRPETEFSILLARIFLDAVCGSEDKNAVPGMLLFLLWKRILT